MTASNVLDIARAELGATESPKGSNNVEYNTWYYGREVSGNYPWCMAFIQWLFYKAEIKPPVRTASCGTLMTYARRAGEWVTEDYRPGDVLIYDFPGGAATDHCGILEELDGDYVIAIEGNTSVSNASTGGEVRRMKRKVSLVKGAWRPVYEEEEEMSYEKFKVYMDQYLAEREALPDVNWGEEWQQAKEWAENEVGLIKGDQNGNKMYLALPTRQQLIMFLYRLARILKG